MSDKAITLRYHVKRYVPDAIVDGDITEYTFERSGEESCKNLSEALIWLHENNLTEPGSGNSTRWFSGCDENYDIYTGEIEEVSAHVDDSVFDILKLVWEASEGISEDSDWIHALGVYVDEVIGRGAVGTMAPADLLSDFQEKYIGQYENRAEFAGIRIGEMEADGEITVEAAEIFREILREECAVSTVVVDSIINHSSATFEAHPDESGYVFAFRKP